MGATGAASAGGSWFAAMTEPGAEQAQQELVSPDSRWRNEVAAELIKRQNPNGSWTNENQKWMEGDANLCTAFALLTLGYCNAK